MTVGDSLSKLLEEAPDSLEGIVDMITPKIYSNLKQSVELQRWPDGARLSAPQIENAMQLIILYEHRNLPEEARIGRPLNNNCGSAGDDAQPLHVKDSSARQDS